MVVDHFPAIQMGKPKLGGIYESGSLIVVQVRRLLRVSSLRRSTTLCSACMYMYVTVYRDTADVTIALLVF